MNNKGLGISDTPEVQAAKAEFAKAWNAAAARNAQPVAPIAYEQQRSLAFAPVQAAPVQAAPVQYAQAPVQYAQAPVYAQYAQAPVYAQYAQAPVYAQAPAAPVAAPTGCFNWKGESVQCRY